MSVHGTRHREGCHSGPDEPGTRLSTQQQGKEEIQEIVQTIPVRIVFQPQIPAQSSEPQPPAHSFSSEEQPKISSLQAYQIFLRCRRERAHRDVCQVLPKKGPAAKKNQKPRRTPDRCQQGKLGCVLAETVIMFFVNRAHPTLVTVSVLEDPRYI